MRRYIFQSLFGAALLVLLSGCSTSTLVLNNNDEVVLTYNDRSIEAAGKTLKKNQLVFSTIIIDQNVLQFKDKSLLVYESTTVDLNYMYKYATQTSVEMIFDAKKINTIYRRNNLYFFQMILKNGKILNAMVQQSNDQTLSMVYGFSVEQFRKILGQVEGSEKMFIKLETKNIEIFKDPKSAVKSKWNMKLINIDSLITVSDTLRGR